MYSWSRSAYVKISERVKLKAPYFGNIYVDELQRTNGKKSAIIAGNKTQFRQIDDQCDVSRPMTCQEKKQEKEKKLRKQENTKENWADFEKTLASVWEVKIGPYIPTTSHFGIFTFDHTILTI